MTRHVARHAVPSSGQQYPGLGKRLAIVAGTLAASIAVMLGGIAVAANVPSSGQRPAYTDERWQDPSGLPYCTYPDDGMRPCIEAQSAQVRRY